LTVEEVDPYGGVDEGLQVRFRNWSRSPVHSTFPRNSRSSRRRFLRTKSRRASLTISVLDLPPEYCIADSKTSSSRLSVVLTTPPLCRGLGYLSVTFPPSRAPSGLGAESVTAYPGLKPAAAILRAVGAQGPGLHRLPGHLSSLLLKLRSLAMMRDRQDDEGLAIQAIDHLVREPLEALDPTLTPPSLSEHRFPLSRRPSVIARNTL
jgi:hypothetical protein